MLVLNLATNETIDLAEFGHGHLIFTCADVPAWRTIEDKLRTEGAIEDVTVTDNGVAIANITGMSIRGTQTVENRGGGITAHVYTEGGLYNLDSGEYAEAGRILLGEEE